MRRVIQNVECRDAVQTVRSDFQKILLDIHQNAIPIEKLREPSPLPDLSPVEPHSSSQPDLLYTPLRPAENFSRIGARTKAVVGRLGIA